MLLRSLIRHAQPPECTWLKDAKSWCRRLSLWGKYHNLTLSLEVSSPGADCLKLLIESEGIRQSISSSIPEALPSQKSQNLAWIQQTFLKHMWRWQRKGGTEKATQRFECYHCLPFAVSIKRDSQTSGCSIVNHCFISIKIYQWRHFQKWFK